MTLSDYIKVLQALEAEHGDKPVAMTQRGYYSEGLFADLFDQPEIQTLEWQPTVVLGHSNQSY